jgi:ABC-2 type transport system ATP-binding protein
VSWGLDRVTVRLGDVTALRGVSVEAATASVTVVIGGDGAGKSTALRALVGLVPVAGGGVGRPSKRDIGYVPASGGIYPDLTVWENLAFSGAAYGLAGRALLERGHAVLERIGLAGVEARLGGRLSGGMQRKLAVGVALLHDPSLLVFDEPTTGIDPASRVQLWRLISAEAAAGKAVVISTTYVNEAHRAQWVLLLDRGRAVTAGAPQQVITAVGGAVGVVESAEQPPEPSWLRGRAWRVWAPDGALPAGARPIDPDFGDAVIVAELGFELGRSSPPP